MLFYWDFVGNEDILWCFIRGMERICYGDFRIRVGICFFKMLELFELVNFVDEIVEKVIINLLYCIVDFFFCIFVMKCSMVFL